MNYNRWVKIVGVGFFGIIFLMMLFVAYVDPFFHFHKPLPNLWYKINKERYQNDGILRNFEYNAIITGTSMTENFKASEFDEVFGVKSVKVPFSGGSFKEINDALKTSFRTKHDVKYIIRSLDSYKLWENPKHMRNDLGKYPTYLYNNNPFDDINYLLNKDVLVQSRHIVSALLKGKSGGHTAFDEYANWNKRYKFGAQYVLKGKKEILLGAEQKSLTQQDIDNINLNVSQNVVELAMSQPKTTFLYFFPPYSIAYWGMEYEKGNLERFLAAEEQAVKLILECPNIKLFSFNLMTDITTNLDNYKDSTHYGEWINSDILRYMKNDIGLLTKANYQEYLRKERELYLNYPYERLFE